MQRHGRPRRWCRSSPRQPEHRWSSPRRAMPLDVAEEVDAGHVLDHANPCAVVTSSKKRRTAPTRPRGGGARPGADPDRRQRGLEEKPIRPDWWSRQSGTPPAVGGDAEGQRAPRGRAEATWPAKAGVLKAVEKDLRQVDVAREVEGVDAGGAPSGAPPGAVKMRLPGSSANMADASHCLSRDPPAARSRPQSASVQGARG